MDAFLLKKILSNVVHIVPGAFFGLLICVALLGRWPRLARLGTLVITLSLLALSSPPVTNSIVGSLENQYPVVQALPEDTELVLVLGSGHHWTADRPPNSVLMASALSRLSEAVRLWRTRPEAVLMTSGAKFRSEISHAETMGNMAMALGMDESRLVLSPEARDTDDEIATALRWMQQNGSATGRLVVVSSAMHLPRAATLLSHQPVPYTMAPTDFRVLDAPWYRFNSLHLSDVDWAVHEYVGMLWYRLAP